MKLAAIGSLIILLQSATFSVADQRRVQVFDADAFLADCTGMSARSRCQSEQARWLNEIDSAFSGKIEPRMQVAECMINGCAGAVKVNIFQACTWIILLSWGSPLQQSEKIDESLIKSLFSETCGPPVYNYNAILAAKSANKIYYFLYGKHYPLGLF